MNLDSLPDEPSDLDLGPNDPREPSDLEFTDIPCTDAGGDVDESQWEAFLPEDDEWDPLPAPGDFWVDDRLLVYPVP